jgi:two-component system OmpR family response regulator
MVVSDEIRVATKPAVLVVEDEEATRRALSMLLRLSGFTTASYASAEEALRNLRQDDDPDFALVDLDLPGMNGIDFIRRLRQTNAGIYAVLLTAADAERVARILAGGAVAYLQKPVNFEELLALLHEHGGTDSLAI